jgi:hypothetical protein
MKFVFLKSGDFLEFKTKKTKFSDGWFNFLFEKNIAQEFSGEHFRQISNNTERKLSDLNNHIDTVNNFLRIQLPGVAHFSKSYNLNQQWLNAAHRQWVYMTARYKNEIFDIPASTRNAWMQINNLIHELEMNYRHEFNNNVVSEIPETENLKVEKEDCEFVQHDLVLSFRNLGRHQYNQWQVGYDSINEETSNYNTISTSFSFYHSIDNYRHAAPSEYVKWCEKQNIEVLAPWVVLGTFDIKNPWEVKEIMHRNLKDDSHIGFAI